MRMLEGRGATTTVLVSTVEEAAAAESKGQAPFAQRGGAKSIADEAARHVELRTTSSSSRPRGLATDRKRAYSVSFDHEAAAVDSSLGGNAYGT